MKTTLANWKTTVLGVIAAVIALLTAVTDVLTSEQVATLLSAVVGAVAIVSRDGGVSDQQAGARPEPATPPQSG
ncbi:MAG: hypothetical protein AAF663_00130 [Planctomycetota bacterium]